ncbi:MAG: YtxH domain-containing protein [Acidobacteriota bacterium]|nr:YtxH domain-containing protein [Acidobacteriota bacterium]
MAYEYDRFDDEGSGGGGFVMGLIAGAVLGAGIGMLLAPKAGSELRGQLNEQAARLRERASEGYSAASSRVAEASTKVADMYNRRTGATGSAGSTGSMGSMNAAPSTASQGNFAGTSVYSTGGVDTPVTSTEF